MKKKLLLVALMLVLCLSFAGCGGGEKDDSPISDSEIGSLFESPDDFKGRTFEFTGKVLQVEKDSDGLAIQAFYDIKNFDKNVIIYYSDSSLDVGEDDFIAVKGTITGKFSGENAFGGAVTAPMVDADSVEVVDYQTAAAPAKKELTFENQTVDQHGYSVTIDKVEFADSETRVYVTVTNNGSATFSLYGFDAKLVQDGKQMDTQDNFEAEYPEISSDLTVGATTSGIVCFPAIDVSGFSLSFPAYSDNFDETINDYTFNIDVE